MPRVLERCASRAVLNSHRTSRSNDVVSCGVIVIHPEARLASLLQEALRDVVVRHEPGLDGGLVRLRSQDRACPVAVVVLDLAPVPREEVPRVIESLLAADPWAQLVVTRTRGVLDEAPPSSRLWVHRRGDRGRGDEADDLASLVNRARKRWDLQLLWESARPTTVVTAGPSEVGAEDARRDAARRMLNVVEGQLRAPLASLAERLVAAQEWPDSASLVDLARDARALLDRLEAVRDLCHVDLGHEAPVSSKFSAAAICQDIVARGRQLAAGRSVGVTVGRVAETPAHLIGPENIIRRALLELVENAVRYAGRGTAVVGVDVRDRHEGGLIARFSVADDGQGIASDQLELAWARFARLSTAAEEPGSGLGLAIVRELVELAGGRCGAMSAVGVGSTFWFEIPVERGIPAPVEASLPVLLIEDDAVNTLVVRRILEREGFRVDATDDALEGMRMAVEGRYALVLMDVFLGGVDGLELTRRIREAEAHTSWRSEIVALTAAVSDGTPERCLRAGMDGFHGKPVRRAALVSLAAAAVRRAEQRIAAAEAARPAALSGQPGE